MWRFLWPHIILQAMVHKSFTEKGGQVCMRNEIYDQMYKYWNVDSKVYIRDLNMLNLIWFDFIHEPIFNSKVTQE